MRFLTGIRRGLKLLYSLIQCLSSSLSRTRESIGKLEALIGRARREVFRLLRVRLPFRQSQPRRRVVGVIVALVALSALIIGLGGGFLTMTFHSSGKVITRGVGLYEDSASSRPVSEFRWGMVEPGLTNHIEAYLQNEGNVPIKLSLYAVNWIPSNASSYMEFGWDYDNSILNPDDAFKVTFHLSVLPDVEGIVDFAFDVIIDAYNA